MPMFTVKAVTADWEVEEEIGRDTGKTVHLVFSDEPTSPAAARTAAELPVRGSVYPDEPPSSTLKCVGRTCVAVDKTRMLFRVTCDFDSNTIGLDPNPLSDPIAFDYNDETSEEPWFRDESSPDRLTATTTANEPFPELPRRQTSNLVIGFSRNVPEDATFATYKPLRNKINSATVTIEGTEYPEGTLLVGKLSLSIVKTRDAYSYKVLTGELRERVSTWDETIEMRGLYELNEDEEPVRIRDNQGVVVETAWPLDGDGHAMAFADSEGAAITFKPYVRADIAPLFA